MTGSSDQYQMWLDARLRNIEAGLMDLRDRSVEERITDRQQRHELQVAIDSIHAISSDVSKMSVIASESHELLKTMSQWGQRIALAIGLVLLMSQHLTVSQMAKLVRVVVGV